MIARIDDRMRAGDLTMWHSLVRCLYMTGEWERALELSQQAVARREKGYNQSWALEGRGDALIGLGRITEGIADLDGAVALFKEGGPSLRWADSIVGTYRQEQAYLLCEAGNIEGAIAMAKRGIKDAPLSTWNYYMLVRAYLRAGKTADAEKTLEELKKVKEGNKCPADAFFELLALAELEASRGNKQAAMDAFARMDGMPLEARIIWIQWRTEGDVKAALGDSRGAADAYRKYLESRDFLLGDYLVKAVERIPVLFKLAQAEEANGRFDEARRYYQAYLDRWGNADIKIPNVTESRRRLDALKGR